MFSIAISICLIICVSTIRCEKTEQEIEFDKKLECAEQSNEIYEKCCGFCLAGHHCPNKEATDFCNLQKQNYHNSCVEQ